MQPHFLFLLTPPYSGSTAIAKILDTSPRVTLLTPEGEGQWLVNELRADDRWASGKHIDYDLVRTVWLEKAGDADVVVEKSPPNMVRINELAAQFERTSFIINNRDPYANCSSILYREYDSPDDMDVFTRRVALENLAMFWQVRSRILRNLCEGMGLMPLTYEQFCKDPRLLLHGLPDGLADTVDVYADIQVKDYEPQPVSNHNDRQIDRLSDLDKQHITSILKTEQDLLDYFNYRLFPCKQTF